MHILFCMQNITELQVHLYDYVIYQIVLSYQSGSSSKYNFNDFMERTQSLNNFEPITDYIISYEISMSLLATVLKCFSTCCLFIGSVITAGSIQQTIISVLSTYPPKTVNISEVLITTPGASVAAGAYYLIYKLKFDLDQFSDSIRFN